MICILIAFRFMLKNTFSVHNYNYYSLCWTMHVISYTAAWGKLHIQPSEVIIYGQIVTIYIAMHQSA